MSKRYNKTILINIDNHNDAYNCFFIHNKLNLYLINTDRLKLIVITNATLSHFSIYSKQDIANCRYISNFVKRFKGSIPK